jgi:SAM-dependent methyltransferase
MPRYMYSPMNPRLYSNTLIKIILVLALAWIAILLYNKWMPKKEGFVQREKFIMKREQDVNDMFYAEVYDQLYLPEKRVPFELKTILSQTQASDYSVFLDVGSGTGYLVNELTSLGYNAFGIDKSKSMVEYSEKKYPETIVKHGDILDAMNYESATFSHILCMNSTLYDFKDKASFFRNCFSWIKPGGHLIVHLVEPKKMNAKLLADKSPTPMYLKENQCVDSIIDFGEFKYKVSYKLDNNATQGTLTETFYDNASGHVRQNEKTLYFTPLQDILTIANYSGFIPEGKVDMSEVNGDEHQYIYIFVRP